MKVLDYGLIAVAEELQHVANKALNSDESTYNTKDFQEEDCIAALDKHVKQALKGLDKTEARGKSVAKNVTNFRHQIIKDFMGSYMVNKRRYCAVCKAPSREVKSQYNSQVFLKGLSFKEANKWAKIKVAETYIEKQSTSERSGSMDNGTGKLHKLLHCNGRAL